MSREAMVQRTRALVADVRALERRIHDERGECPRVGVRPDLLAYAAALEEDADVAALPRLPSTHELMAELAAAERQLCTAPVDLMSGELLRCAGRHDAAIDALTEAALLRFPEASS